jgi:hypothetical protein
MFKKSTGAAAFVAVVAIAASLSGPAARADSIAEVEGARAHERSGHGLTRLEIEKLRRYGGNDDGYYSGYGAYDDDGFDDGPAVGVIIGPGYGYGYDGPYEDDDYDDEDED